MRKLPPIFSLLTATCMSFGLANAQINSNGSQQQFTTEHQPIQLLESNGTSTAVFNTANEDISLRTPTAKHFRNTNGSFTAVISAGPVHFEQNGQLKDINTQLVEQNQAFVNTENMMQTSFAKSVDQGVVSTTTEGSVTEFLNPTLYWEAYGQQIGLQTATTSTAEVNGNQVVYPNLFGNISAKYTLLNGRKRLDYIIPNAAALGNVPANAQYLVFTEDIKLPQAWTYNYTSKGVEIKDASAKVIYLYENPTSNDAMDFGLFNNNTQMEVVKNGNILTVKTKVDAAWLLDNARVYPLTIDPSTSVYPYNGDFWTVQVSSEGDGQSGLPAAGRVSSGTWFRGAITFDTSSLPASDISSAAISLSTINKVGTFGGDYAIGIAQSNYDLPIWGEDFLDVYNYITHPANMAGDYAIISNPGNIDTTQTYNLVAAAHADIAKNTGSENSFFAVSLRQGWDGGPLENRYVVYADHTYGQYAPKLTVNYTKNDEYCHPMHLFANCAALGDCEYIGIGKVELGDINSTTTYDNTPIGYNRYNAETTVGYGQTQTLTITYKDNGVPSNPGKIAAWIDWNLDDTFSADEFIGLADNVTDGQTVSFEVIVPQGIALGESRLRVRSVYHDENIGANDACTTMEYGETEDYTIHIEKRTMGTTEMSLQSVAIYPNPATDQINIQSKSAVTAVAVYNMNGQEVLKGNSDNLNVQRLPVGNYVVRVKTIDGKTATHQLIKK